MVNMWLNLYFYVVWRIWFGCIAIYVQSLIKWSTSEQLVRLKRKQTVHGNVLIGMHQINFMYSPCNMYAVSIDTLVHPHSKKIHSHPQALSLSFMLHYLSRGFVKDKLKIFFCMEWNWYFLDFNISQAVPFVFPFPWWLFLGCILYGST